MAAWALGNGVGGLKVASNDSGTVMSGGSLPSLCMPAKSCGVTPTIVTGARNEEQLRDNLGAMGWTLDAAQLARLDSVSALVPPYPYYPYWNGQFTERNPPAVLKP